ncbi:hypothetical protein PCH_Pc22g11300 [Penicillium rubens Wisconsin 54-1255]|uniref:Uncharacterized protein n=1 Tax=Penicillium rubens (strain ATCC 28089 / DSM 1075 / NRRL 1951 / Wisconsin 54-1255) TaxID=500485 RepID=B6HQ84_PENRW|nr:hypothetical protein PCH_Pc22g11300 [Penicillium rubens Wisconsin 54-1255]
MFPHILHSRNMLCRDKLKELRVRRKVIRPDMRRSRDKDLFSSFRLAVYIVYESTAALYTSVTYNIQHTTYHIVVCPMYSVPVFITPEWISHDPHLFCTLAGMLSAPLTTYSVLRHRSGNNDEAASHFLYSGLVLLMHCRTAYICSVCSYVRAWINESLAPSFTGICSRSTEYNGESIANLP